MDRDEYRRIAEAQDTHWWYRAMGELLRQEFGTHLATGRVIDVGSGPGAHSSWLAQGARPIAIDVERVAAELFREIHPDMPVIVGDVSHLPLANGTVDGMLCVGVIVHRSVTSPVTALTEMARVLRPGGSLCILEAGVRRLRRPHDRITHTARRFSLGDLVGEVERAGLHVERATGAFSFLVPIAAALAALDLMRTSAASDIDRSPRGVWGLFPLAARIERAVLRRTALPFGLSVMLTARKPLPLVDERDASARSRAVLQS